ncbi:unnamed protein product [Soboliphyme baturini]|uniref:Ig-like domain-containing protein n=1 Tax=Soboliphyme baturini TaxID=241478 RepID=A0A183J635_9BILA|nr:unnamed protein product [Soboliphyme baturini]
MPSDAGADQDMLIFPDFQAEKAGVYKCDGSNDDVVSVSIDMYPTYPKIHDNVVLKCIVENDEAASITWEKMDDHLPATASIMGNTLVLYGITPEDEGIYRCSAMSKSGEVKNDIEVHVAHEIRRTVLRHA